MKQINDETYEMILKLSKQKKLGEDANGNRTEDSDVFSLCGGICETAYEKGQDDGQIILAKKIIEAIGKESN